MDRSIKESQEVLLDEIKKLGCGRMNDQVAYKLSVYRGAYEALCLVDDGETVEMDGDDIQKTTVRIHSTRRAPKSHKIGQEEITRWMDCLENEDGTTGPHYTKEQVDQYRRGMGIDCDLMELYAAANMMYSDYCKVLKKYGMDRPEVYVEMAAAFIRDKDVGAKDKLAAYHKYIVEGE